MKNRQSLQSLWFFLAALSLVAGPSALVISGCQRTTSPPTVDQAASSRVDTLPHFTEVSTQMGINFVHENGARGKKRMPETVGSGCAFFDYDNDGDQDLLVVNSMPWPDAPKSANGTPRATVHLYRNDGDHFTDVSRQVGLAISCYGMGVAIGDFDNDGWEDVYLTAVGPNHLLHNEGGKFRDITLAAGVAGVPSPGGSLQDKWSTGAAFFDYDNDGKLDLWVCQYVKWSPKNEPVCRSGDKRGYCPPDNFEGTRCTLYHNDGNGKFRDVRHAMGLFDCAVGKSFGIGLGDFNHDGWLDVVISNDTWANFLFVNEKGKRFSEQGVVSGIAYGESGRAKAGMGVDVADVGNNGKFAITVGNFTNEGISLFEPDMDLVFTDQAQKKGVAVPSLKNVTFAVFFFDYDLDGWADIFATNGHVDDIVNTYQSDVTFRQKPLLLHSEKGTRFTDVTHSAGLDRSLVGRGAAYADIDGDGDQDIALIDNGGKLLLFRNDSKGQNHWLRMRLEGVRCNRDAIGALVKVRHGEITQSHYLKSGGSFLSEEEHVLTFGLGASMAPVSVEITWPDGTQATSGAMATDTAYFWKQGTAPVPDPRPMPLRQKSASGSLLAGR